MIAKVSKPTFQLQDCPIVVSCSRIISETCSGNQLGTLGEVIAPIFTRNSLSRLFDDQRIIQTYIPTRPYEIISEVRDDDARGRVQHGALAKGRTHEKKYS